MCLLHKDVEYVGCSDYKVESQIAEMDVVSAMKATVPVLLCDGTNWEVELMAYLIYATESTQEQD